MAVEHLSDLELFARVVERGNLTEAGRGLGHSPATVSKRLARLEEALGARLLNRTTRRVSPTDEGLNFYDRVNPIIADLKEAEAETTQSAHCPHGTLRVTMPTGFGRQHIAPFLPEFMARYPRVSLDVILSDAISDLVGEGIEVALRVAELNDSTLVARKLADNTRAIVASPDYLRDHGRPEKPGDLKGHTCIVMHGQEQWRFVGPKGAESVKVSGRMTTNSGDVLREVAIAGLGITMKSLWDIGQDLRDGTLVQLLEDYEVNPGVAIYAVYPSARHLSARTRAFIDFIVEKFTPLPPWEVCARAVKELATSSG